MDDSKTLKNIESKISALVSLVALCLPKESREVKLEILLKNAGLENADIAKILGKKLSAVQKTIQRSKE